MAAPKSYVVKTPIPIYAVGWPTKRDIMYAGGGGKSRSGVTNAVRSAYMSKGTGTFKEKGEVRLSIEEDAPMCLAVSRQGIEEDSEEDQMIFTGLGNGQASSSTRPQTSRRKVVIGINVSDPSTSRNENLRVLDWASTITTHADKRKTVTHALQPSRQAESVTITDPEEYIRCSAISPNGRYLAVGSTDGQMVLHAFPSLDRMWSLPRSEGEGVVDLSFSADSALIAFVTPSRVQIYPTGVMTGGGATPALYQSIGNPTLQGTSGCFFRAARFGRNGTGSLTERSDRLFTVVNSSPPAGLGSSKRDREKAKVRQCFVSSWDADAWTLLDTRHISDRPATVIDVSDTGKHLAIATSDLAVHMLSTASLRTIWRIADAHAFPATCLCFNPSGDLVASGSADMTLRITEVGQRAEPARTVGSLFESKVVIALLAILLAIIAWQLQKLVTPSVS